MDKEKLSKLKVELANKLVDFTSGTILYVDVENWLINKIKNIESEYKSQLEQKIKDMGLKPQPPFDESENSLHSFRYCAGWNDCLKLIEKILGGE